MTFDKILNCEDCKHHLCPSCKRIDYDNYHHHIGKFWFKKSPFMAIPLGWICKDFELREYYFNSPAYADFTLDSYLVYEGIRKLEYCYLTRTGFTSRNTCDNVYKFEFMRNAEDGQRGYKIYKNDVEIAYYKQFGGWEEAFADWTDICRSVLHTEEYIQAAVDMFLTGSVLLSTNNVDKGWYCMDYKDFFYNRLFREDGKLNVYKYRRFTLPKNYGTYKTISEDIDGVMLI